MMNVPGHRNGLKLNGSPLRNWWEALADFDAVMASGTGLLDTTSPETTIDSGPSGTIVDSTPTFEFSSNELGSTFACRVDGGAYSACTSPHTTAPLADGAHTFTVRATDQAGNADASPASRSFTVDTAAPPGPTPIVPPASTPVVPSAPSRDLPLADFSAPGLTIAGRATQRAGKTIAVVVRATTEDLWASASGSVSVPGAARSYKLTGVHNRFVARGEKATLRLKVPRKAQKAIRRALRRHKPVRAKIKVLVRDAAGNSATRSRTIKLKR
jgi:hypothetical protein